MGRGTLAHRSALNSGSELPRVRKVSPQARTVISQVRELQIGKGIIIFLMKELSEREGRFVSDGNDCERGME